MIMSTFVENYDFSGKTVHPVTTYAMSGLGTTPDDYARSCGGARIGTGLAVRGEEVRSAGTAVDSWLRRAPCSTLGNVPASEPGRGRRSAVPQPDAARADLPTALGGRRLGAY
jgi:hypothetical protein